MKALCASEVAAVLSSVVSAPGDGSLSRPLRAYSSVLLSWQDWSVRIVTAGDGGLDVVGEALAPDGRRWVYGCERDWPALGPPIEPLALMHTAAVQELAAALRVMPAVEEGPAVWPDLEAIAQRQANVKRLQKKRKGTSLSRWH